MGEVTFVDEATNVECDFGGVVKSGCGPWISFFKSGNLMIKRREQR